MDFMKLMMASAGSGALGDTFDTVIQREFSYTASEKVIACSPSLNRFVINTNSETAYSDDNGRTWVLLGDCGGGKGLKYLSDAFYAVGSDRSIHKSTDGITWVDLRAADASGIQLYSIAKKTGLVVAVGYGTGYFTSTDESSWTSRTFPVSLSQPEIVYADTLDLFVVADGNGIYTSASGTSSWTSRNVNVNINSLAWCSDLGLLVGAGSGGTIYTSADGITWTLKFTTPDSSAVKGILYAGGTITVLTLTGITTSTNGEDFVHTVYPHVFAPGELEINFAASGTDIVFLGKWGGQALVATSSMDSPADFKVTSLRLGSSAPIYNPFFGTFFVPCDKNVGLISGDGDRWTPVKLPNASPDDWLYGAAVNPTDGKMVCGGTQGAYIYYSSDGGYSWTKVAYPRASTQRHILYSASVSLFICADDGGICTSPDGQTWTSESTAGSFKKIAENPAAQQFMAVGNGGAVYYSTNGTSWSARTSNVTSDLKDVAFGSNGYICAVGATVIITTTGVATAWTKRSGSTDDTERTFRRVVWNETAGEFFVAGGYGFSNRLLAKGTGGSLFTITSSGSLGAARSHDILILDSNYLVLGAESNRIFTVPFGTTNHTRYASLSNAATSGGGDSGGMVMTDDMIVTSSGFSTIAVSRE
jgi:hypothetical protein